MNKSIEKEQGKKSSTILVVDDLPKNRELVVTRLEREGYKMVIASSGEMALQRIDYVKPDLILLDIQMHGMDGIETAEKILQNTRPAKTP